MRRYLDIAQPPGDGEPGGGLRAGCSGGRRVSTDIHVWLTPPGGLAEAAARFLPEQERNEVRRYCFRADGQSFLASRCLLRLAAAQYSGQAPENIVLGHSAEGAPVLTCAGRDSAEVSLSRRRGLVAVAVAGTVGIGIDVEEAETRGNPADTLSPFLHPACLQDVSEWLERGGACRFGPSLDAHRSMRQGHRAGPCNVDRRPHHPALSGGFYVLLRGDESWHGRPLPAPPGFAASLVWSGGPADRRILVHDAKDLPVRGW